VLLSFTATYQRLGIEPWAYLQDTLARLPATPAEHLDDLLPDRWQAARQVVTRLAERRLSLALHKLRFEGCGRQRRVSPPHRALEMAQSTCLIRCDRLLKGEWSFVVRWCRIQELLFIRDAFLTPLISLGGCGGH
jgi:hypothetical protein